MSLVEGFHTQFQVVYALIIRETRTRFGAHRLGYLWAVLEPLFWVMTFYGMFFFMGRHLPSGMDIVGFIATGILPYLVFRQTVAQSVGAIKANRPLLYYPQIHPLDLALSRSVLEFVTLASVFILIVGGHALIERHLVVDRLLWIIGGFVLAWLFGLSLGLFLLAANSFFGVVERLIGIVLRPMFFISGIFFTANELPQALREYLLWNPVLHTVEMVRAGYYESYTAHYLDVSYVLTVVLLFAYSGLILERMARKRVQP